MNFQNCKSVAVAGGWPTFEMRLNEIESTIGYSLHRLDRKGGRYCPHIFKSSEKVGRKISRQSEVTIQQFEVQNNRILFYNMQFT